MNCQNCNHLLGNSEKFCGNCGHPTSGGAPSGDYIPTQMMGRWKLQIVSGPNAGQVHTIRVVTRIGRGTQNDIQIDDPQLSRLHAAIYQYDEGYAISDQGSINGTFVNGNRITGAVWINDGDAVSIGGVQMRVQGDPALGSATSTHSLSTPTNTQMPTATVAPPTASKRGIPGWLLWGGIGLGGLVIVLGIIGFGILAYSLRDAAASPTAPVVSGSQPTQVIAIVPSDTVPAPPTSTNIPAQMNTPVATNTSAPAATAEPSATLEPTDTPTNTPVPLTSTPDIESLMEDANILLFEDAVGVPLLRYVKEALDLMDLSYVDTRDGLGDLQSQLLSGTDWDLIIIAAESRNFVQGEFFDLLNDRLNDGASVILEVWYLDRVASGRVSTLLTRCGVEFQRDWFNPDAYSVYPYITDHPIFQEPNTNVNLINFDRYWFGDIGDLIRLAPGSDAEMLAGSLSTGGDQNGTLVSCLDGQLLIQTFSTHNHRRSDMVRLWENYIFNGLRARFENNE